MADLQISALPALAGSLLQGIDPLAVADISASETKKITALDLAIGLGPLFPPGSIPSTAVNLTYAPGSITTALLADKAVTAAKLSDQSSAVVAVGLPASGAYVGQLGFDSATGTLRIWDGSIWQALKAAGSINNLAGDTTGTVRASAVVAGDTATLSVELAATTAPRQFFAGPTAAAGVATARQIVPADLPSATKSEQGAVQVGGGLAVTGGVVAIDNAVTPQAAGLYGVVEYNAFGLVTNGRAIVSGDLPHAISGAPGTIAPGTEFTVDGAGVLHHAHTVTPGTAAKVTYDGQGHILSGTTLLDTDIPDVPAEKLTSGTLPAARLADRSITAAKLADYAVSFIQEGTPPATNVHHNGALWLQESTGSLKMWNGNSWFPIGSGRLTAENLRYCGVFNAATGKITGITQFGTTAGFKIGDAVPAATDAETGVYFVCNTPGNATPVATGITFDAGDWILCNGNAAGWVRIDTLNGATGGGGTSATHLDDLLDVTLTTPAAGNALQFNAAGQWVNVRTFSTGTTAPASPVAGAMWIDTTVAAAPVLKVWDGSAWVGAGGKGVTSGTTAPSSPANGDTWVNTGTTPPTLGIWDGTKWVTVAPINSPTFTGTPAAPTAPAGTDTTQLATTAFVQAAQLLSKTGTTLSAKTSGDLMAPGILPAATTAAQGAVQLATTADVTAGTAGRVVTADQLKTTNDAVTTAAGGGVPDAPDGTADGTKQFVRQVVSAGTVHTKSWVAASTADASETAKGVVELATAAETTAGTDATRAVHPAGLKVELDKKADLASPTFTGTPVGPTAAAGTNTTQLATTAFVAAANVWTRTGTTLGVATAGDLVAPAALPAATTTAQGAVQLATSTEAATGTDTAKAVTPKALADGYLAKNIALLPALP